MSSGAGSLTILHPLNLTVPDGQFLAIVGPSGSGKTTLLGLMAGLDAPTTGVIEVGGTDITALDEDRLAVLRGARIGFVFQFFHLLPSLTALENVSVPMEIAGVPKAAARARGLLDEVGLADRGRGRRAALCPRAVPGHRPRSGQAAWSVEGDAHALIAGEGAHGPESR